MSHDDDDTPVQAQEERELDVDSIERRVQANYPAAEFVDMAYSHAMADVLTLTAEVRRLRERQQANLATIVKLAQTTPFPEEVENALKQRGKLLAEVGSLRARCGELESALSDVLTSAQARVTEVVTLLEAAHRSLGGCITTPPCGSCTWCDIDAALSKSEK